MKVSSTEVRKAIKNGDSLDALLNAKVIDHIKKYDLYQ